MTDVGLEPIPVRLVFEFPPTDRWAELITAAQGVVRTIEREYGFTPQWRFEASASRCWPREP